MTAQKETAVPATHQMELVKMWSSIFMAMATIVIVPLLVSMSGKLSQYGDRLTRIESWIGDGRQYTEGDANRDYGVLTQVLKSQGLEIQDHEQRIRIVEKSVNTSKP